MSGSAARLKRVKSGSVRSMVVDAIREAIFSGEMKPGDPLRETHLATNLGVSQATVREALMALEHAGLVVREPNRETTVTKLSAEELQERSRLRVVLEGLAGVDAAKQMTPAGFDSLAKRLDAIHAALAHDSYMDYVAADLEFHRTVWRLSGDKTLYKTLDLITVPLFAFLSIRRSRMLHNLMSMVKSHDPILAALRANKPEQIREAFRAHIEESYRQIEGA